MTTQPAALRLAHWLERGGANCQAHIDAAAELRRLHAENERLHQINQSHEMKLSVRGYEIQIEDLRLAHAELHAVNQELLEALRKLLFADDQEWDGAVVAARAAIARAEGELNERP